MHSEVFATATCLSVRLSVTRRYIVSSRANAGSWNVHHLIAPWFHFLVRYDSSKNSQGTCQMSVVFGDFRPICHYISKTLHFRPKFTIGRKSETIGKLSNGVTFDALEWSMTRITAASRGFASYSWAFLFPITSSRDRARRQTTHDVKAGENQFREFISMPSKPREPRRHEMQYELLM